VVDASKRTLQCQGTSLRPPPTMELTLVVAATVANGIGHSGGLPWRLPGEMAYFAKVTSGAPSRAMNAIVMGRKTWESIPQKYRPLKNRLNIVVTRQAEYNIGPSQPATGTGLVAVRSSLPSALDVLSSPTDPLVKDISLHRTFVIGGASIYSEALGIDDIALPFVNRILLTRVLSPPYPDCDVFFPDFQSLDKRWRRASHEELEEWTGFDVPSGVQEERETTYEYQIDSERKPIGTADRI